MRHLSFLIPFLLLGFLLTGCGEGPEWPNLPKGEQEISGVLRPAELSVVRRGTHLLLQDGIEIYYVESKEVPLRPFEGKLVTLQGVFEQNIAPSYLPVLVVDEIISTEETLKEYAVRQFSLLLEVPTQWMKRTEGTEVVFVPKGMEEVLLMIKKEETTEFPEGGVPIVIGSKRALRMIDEFSGNQIVVVKLGDTEVLELYFTPKEEHGDLEMLRGQFLEMLNSISFIDLDRPEVKTGTGTLGAPCGGVAGILCPDGYFCEVKDLEENIGRCREMVPGSI